MSWITDQDAPHFNIPDEYGVLADQKATPVDADRVLLEDSADGFAKKYAELGDLPGGGGGSVDVEDDDVFVAAADTLNFGTNLTVTDDGGGKVTVDATGGNAAYAETIGDNTNTTYTVTHNLGTTDLVVQLWDLTGTDPVEATGDASSIEAISVNAIDVTFAAAPPVDSYRVVILSDGGGGGGSGEKVGGRARRTTTQSILNNTSTSIIWTVADHDSLGFFDIGGANPELVTIPETADYRIIFKGDWDDNATGTRIAFLTLNGTSTILARDDRLASTNSGFTVVFEGAFTAADTIQFRVFQASGGTRSFNSTGRAFVTIEKVVYA